MESDIDLTKLKYSLIVNPTSGFLDINKKYELLSEIVPTISKNCEIYGLETTSSKEFKELAKELSKNTDILVVVGGDGTFLDVINSINNDVILSYLPMGSCNVIKDAFNLSSNIIKEAANIKHKNINLVDSIQCNYGKNKIKSLTYELGIVGRALEKNKEYRDKGLSSKLAYTGAVIESGMQYFKKKKVELSTDKISFKLDNIKYLLLTKIKNYGPLTISKQAELDDKLIHGIYSDKNLLETSYTLLKALIKKSDSGKYFDAKELNVKSDYEIPISALGTPIEKSKQYNFKIIPRDLKVIF